ncbi:MAG: lipocalin-like domain-containing protein [Limisphaerales bacterium]
MNPRHPSRSRSRSRPPGPSRPALGFVLAFLAFLPSGARAEEPLAPRTPDGYASPQPGRVFTFPRDHGSHPEFRIEWWYITGHLWDGSSNRFGFQSTFFRTAGPIRVPLTDLESVSPAAFGVDQLFLSHFALLDVGSGRFRHREQLNREGWSAGASISNLHVWNGGGSLERLAPAGAGGRPSLRLKSRIRAEASWDLTLVPAKPLVVFGERGVSRKGASPTAASHYLTFSRLDVQGHLDVEGSSRAVHGIAWMDHEFSSSQLSPGQTGWDWVSIQLQDGGEIMAYRLRHKDGSTDPYSTLAWVDRDGRVTHAPADAFALEPRSRWKSPRSGAEYPVGLTLRATDLATRQPITLQLAPLALDQELPGAIGNVPYWEGSCRVLDAAGNDVGSAFVELTGYAGDLAGRLR